MGFYIYILWSPGMISLLNLSMPLEREGMKYVESNSVADLIKSILFNNLFSHMNKDKEPIFKKETFIWGFCSNYDR